MKFTSIVKITALLAFTCFSVAQAAEPIKVFASKTKGNNFAGNTTDGDLSTRWNVKGEGEYIQYKFAEPTAIEAIKIAFFKGNKRAVSFQIESTDTPWSSTPNWQQQPLMVSDKTTDELQTYTLSEPVTAKFFRIVGYGFEGNWGWSGNFFSINEVEFVEHDDKTPTTEHVITVGKSGSEDYSSIQAALNNIASVDTTILVKAGTYNEKIEFDTCGSTDGYIVIQGEEGAVMSGTSGDAFYLEDCSYVKIRGLEITGYDQGIEVAESCDSIYIENNYLHHIGDDSNSLVVYIHGGGAVDPNENIFVLNNELSYNTPGNSEVLTVNGNVDGFVIQGNYVHHNNNIGIDVIGFEGNGPDGLDQARNGLIADNRVEYISTEGGPGFERNPTYSNNDYSADCIYVDGGKNIIIERNHVSHCDIGIELASEHKGENTENIIVRNNFVADSYQGNITMGGYDSNRGNAVNIQVYNNTTYNGRDGEILVQYNTSNVTIKNNIFYGKSGVEYLNNIGSNNTNFSVTNNIYFGASDYEEGSWVDTAPKFIDPQLVDINSYDFHLNSGSVAIDAGVDINGSDFLGTPNTGMYDLDKGVRNNGGIDIGADEF